MEGSQSQTGAATPYGAATATAQSSFIRTAAAGAIGFVLGIAFWHSVGFWGFVNEAVFNRHGESVAAPQRAFPAKTQSRQSGIPEPVQAAIDTCTDALVQADTVARLVPCRPLPLKFQTSRGVAPADFADFGPDPVPVLINAPDVPATGSTPAVSG